MMTIDADKVPADIHTTVEGGLYKNAADQYVKADGTVLDENKDEDKEYINKALSFSEAQAKKREQIAAAAPVTGVAGLPVTQAELDAKIQLVVQQALAAAGAAAPPSGRSRSGTDK
jgi:hypothetical protein